MLEYLGRDIFDPTISFDILASVAGWKCVMKENKITQEPTTDKGVKNANALKCNGCKKTFVNSSVQIPCLLGSDSESDDPGQKLKAELCRNCNSGNTTIVSGINIPNLADMNIVKLLENSNLSMVVPYGDSSEAPLMTRKSYCQAKRVYIFLSPDDNAVLTEIKKTVKECSTSENFELICKMLIVLKKSLLNLSPFSAWRRIWLLHERWVAKELSYLSVSGTDINSMNLDEFDTKTLIEQMDTLYSKFDPKSTDASSMVTVAENLVFFDETILPQQSRKQPHRDYLKQRFKIYEIDFNMRLFSHSVKIRGTAKTQITLSKALATSGIGIESPAWDSNFSGNWKSFDDNFRQNVFQYLNSKKTIILNTNGRDDGLCKQKSWQLRKPLNISEKIENMKQNQLTGYWWEYLLPYSDSILPLTSLPIKCNHDLPEARYQLHYCREALNFRIKDNYFIRVKQTTRLTWTSVTDCNQFKKICMGSN